MNDAVVSPDRFRIGAAALALDCLLLVQQSSLGIRTALLDPLVDGRDRRNGFPFEREVSVAVVARGEQAPLGGIAVLDRLDPEAPIGQWVHDLCRRVAGIAVTVLADVDLLTDLVDGPVAYIGNPLPGVLAPAPVDDSGTTVVATGSDCPVCAVVASRRHAGASYPLRIIHEVGEVDARCGGCRAIGQRVAAEDAWHVPDLLRGAVVLGSGAPHPLNDLVRRIAEATGREVLDASGTRLTPLPWSSDDGAVVGVAGRMTAVVLQVLQRQPLRRTAGWFGDQLIRSGSNPAVVAAASAAFGDLFGHAMDPTPRTPLDNAYPAPSAPDLPRPRGSR